MRKRIFVSALCAAAMAVCAVNAMDAQERPAGPPIPTLAFHLVENFFHYPLPSSGRLSGVAVGPNGNILALNRGCTRCSSSRADGSFVRTWGEDRACSRERTASLRPPGRSLVWTRRTT